MLAAMDSARIAALLQPFLGGEPASATLLAQLQAYLDLLLRWNARINLTAVRDPEQIVTRHFGESLFAAHVLRNDGAFNPGLPIALADVGSGAGFPGIPIKLFAPELHLTLIESQNKKATFLKEAIRTLGLENAEVYPGRAEHWGKTAQIVTMRAVERFDSVIPVATSLLTKGGRLCLLVSSKTTDYQPLTRGYGLGFNLGEMVPGRDGSYIFVGNAV
jgi:16S rRNA (guanine527-N7)-methyltransferase